ncbi:MAG: bifunctional riboflavin kinase/FAD synthetase [Cyclobacteriaceae bacterium]|nr:bifunctional riboflavin kinase/FAD synthetase [Cyclobacteriaceae bacterium]
MKVYRGIDKFKKLQNAVVTSGTFDGVHIGHQKILDRLKKIAEVSHGETVLITYWPHPRLVLGNDNSIKLITAFEEKIKLLKRFGLDHLIIIEFTKEFAKTSSTDFIKNILIDKIGTKTLVIGYDHRFGHNREGSFEALSANSDNYGFDVEEIPQQEIHNIAVSSTKIRNHLSKGEIHISNEYLGYPHCLHGKVIRGNQLGRELGYPTANIKVNSELKLIPSVGSYAVKVELGNETYDGMLNIGTRPTINKVQPRKETPLTIEVHIFEFSKNIYGNEITIKFIKLIRKEEKFDSLNQLKDQLNLDKQKTINILLESSIKLD